GCALRRLTRPPPPPRPARPRGSTPLHCRNTLGPAGLRGAARVHQPPRHGENAIEERVCRGELRCRHPPPSGSDGQRGAQLGGRARAEAPEVRAVARRAASALAQVVRDAGGGAACLVRVCPVAFLPALQPPSPRDTAPPSNHLPAP